VEGGIASGACKSRALVIGTNDTNEQKRIDHVIIDSENTQTFQENIEAMIMTSECRLLEKEL
jgi:hypothetical protein